LDRLAAALKDERLARLDFLIGGHTDAVGSDQYNERLSEQRAASVKEYLVERSGIQAHRLVDKGFGESRLLDSKHPLDGVNRRVQIITLATPEQ
jgi:outer membrane protein OmpA-like peptidoglycan-associated protein